jgi:hypothetical protein
MYDNGIRRILEPQVKATSYLNAQFGCYTSGTSPVWGANDMLIGQTETKHHKTKTLGHWEKTIPSALPNLILQIIINSVSKRQLMVLINAVLDQERPA